MRLIDADRLLNRWDEMSVRGRTEFDQEIILTPTIKTKQIKYFDEDEKVWKTGSVIVDE